MKLILASSSPYRKDLFMRLKLNFECISPDVDETQLPNETDTQLVKRLSLSKAQSALNNYPDSICIGCDTVASLNQEVLGKPKTFDIAVSQLKKMSGQTVQFLTGISVVAPNHQPLCAMVPSTVIFRELSEAKIRKYCELEEPFHSCGSFKSETTACALIEKLTSDDPTAIIGLPLIELTKMLEQVNVCVL